MNCLVYQGNEASFFGPIRADSVHRLADMSGAPAFGCARIIPVPHKSTAPAPPGSGASLPAVEAAFASGVAQAGEQEALLVIMCHLPWGRGQVGVSEAETRKAQCHLRKKQRHNIGSSHNKKVE